MITLIHGDQIEASRAEFNRLKTSVSGGEVRTLDGRSIDPAALTQALESQSMFAGSAVIFIENLFGKLGRKLTLIGELASIINSSNANVILWENKEVGATVFKSLKNADVRIFKTPPIIFQFLDKPSLPLYRQVVATEAPELIFSMFVKRIRQLIELRDGVVPEGLQGWQLARLTRQAKLFTMDTLLPMYKKLLAIEFSVKNGSSPFTLTELTEQFLLDL